MHNCNSASFLCPGHGLEIILYPFGGTSLNLRSASSFDNQVSVTAHIVGERSVIIFLKR